MAMTDATEFSMAASLQPFGLNEQEKLSIVTLATKVPGFKFWAGRVPSNPDETRTCLRLKLADYWLQSAAKIRLLPDHSKQPPYPLSWDEQDALFKELPSHLANLALFAVNTGCRVNEICNLQWDWEIDAPSLKSKIFIIPGELVKNGDERLVVVNRIALSVVNSLRGKHPTHVFTFRGKPVTHMLNTAWRKARVRSDLPKVLVHDLKHTFGRRLRAAGVSFEDRQDLLGHRSGRITTHYSAAELSRLIEAANSICDRGTGRPELVVLRRLNVG